MQPANVDVYEKISGQIDTSHCRVGHAYLCQLQIAAIVVSRTADLKSGPIRGEGALVVLGAGGGRRADRRGSQCKRKCAEGRCHSEVCFREDAKLVLLIEKTAGFTALYMLTVTCYGLGVEENCLTRKQCVHRKILRDFSFEFAASQYSPDLWLDALFKKASVIADHVHEASVESGSW